MVDSIEQARKLARLKATVAAPLWGLEAKTISRRCIKKEIPGAVKVGRIWYVTPDGMDRFFLRRK